MISATSGRHIRDSAAPAIYLAGLLLLPAASPAAGPATAEQAQNERLVREYLPVPPAVHPYMKGDERLSKLVTIAPMPDATLAELLAELSKQSGIPLTADRTVAEDGVTAAFTRRPLSRVLALLSTHFDFTWRKKGSGYELWQDLASTRREAARREQRLWATIARAVELGRLAQRSSPEERERRLNQLVPPGLDPASAAAIARRSPEALELGMLRGANGTAFSVLARLSQAHLQSLVRGGSIRLSTTDGSLGPAVAAELARALPPPPPPPREAEESETSVLVGFDIAYKFDYGPWESTPALKVWVRRIETHYRSETGANVLAESGRMPGNRAPDDARLHRRIDLPAGRPPPPRTPGPLSPAWSQDLIRWPDVPTLGVGLLGVHQATGLDVLADSFTFQRLYAGLLRPDPGEEAAGPAGPGTAAFILNRALGRLRLVSSLSDDLLRVRSERFADARWSRVPPSLMRRAVARLQPDPAITLQLLGELGGQLRKEQEVELHRQWGYLWRNRRILAPAPSITATLQPCRLVNLFQQLPASARQETEHGVKLPWRSLSAPVRKRLVEILPPEGLDANRRTAPAGALIGLEVHYTIVRTVIMLHRDASGKLLRSHRVRRQRGAAPPEPPGGLRGGTYVETGEAREDASLTIRVRRESGASTLLGAIRCDAPILLPPAPPNEAGR